MTRLAAGTPKRDLLDHITGYWLTQAVYVVAKLGIADLLRDGPRSAAELAATTDTDADALYRLLRALAGKGVFAEQAGQCFALTPRSQYLRSDVTGSLRAYALLNGSPEGWQTWGGLLYSVQTGDPAFEQVFGKPLFAHLAARPDVAAIFNQAMTGRGAEEIPSIGAAYDFSQARRIVDVGGGQGTLLAGILAANAQATGMLCDLPHAIAAARAHPDLAALAGRCEFVEADFFDVVPAGGDIYIFKKIIHDWDDARARRILQNCRRAMDGSARLLLIELVVPERGEPSFAKWLDLQMLVWMSGGRERTEAQYADLLHSAGFALQRVAPTAAEIAILEAAPLN